jgi:hypothetical protein
MHVVNPLNAELSPICHLLILLGDLTFMGTCIVKYIPIYIQQDATLRSLFISGNCSLHVSGGTSTHHQESIQLYLQHLVFVTPLLLSDAIVEDLEPVWVCCGWRTHENSYVLLEHPYENPYVLLEYPHENSYVLLEHPYENPYVLSNIHMKIIIYFKKIHMQILPLSYLKLNAATTKCKFVYVYAYFFFLITSAFRFNYAEVSAAADQLNADASSANKV